MGGGHWCNNCGCRTGRGWWFFSRKIYAPMQLSAELPAGAKIDRFWGAQLALSPDGTRIVVSEDEPDRNWRLTMRSLDQSQFVPLSGADHASRPFFSPDGQWDRLLC
jgi:hypothetical protein